MNSIKNAAVVLIAILFALLMLVAADWFLTARKISQSFDERMGQLVSKPYEEMDNGWYRLKRSFKGSELWGTTYYQVFTDQYGFRVKDSSYMNRDLAPKYIFLGDSFTYGINGAWDSTFVGMFAKGREEYVANAGVSSYSPTVYSYVYKKMASQSLLADKHKLVVALDISDVQDEATRWLASKNGAPTLRKSSEGVTFFDNKTPAQNFIKSHLNYTYLIYVYTKKLLGGSEMVESREAFDVLDMPRSAFTYVGASLDDKPYPSGYYPDGVSAAKVKIKKALSEIKTLCDKYSCEMYILIYPWPAQLKHVEGNSDWVDYTNETCAQIGCNGVINMFESELLQGSYQKSYERYYVSGDVHFNKVGNQLVFNILSKSVR